jgi:hypothetical protein
MARIRRGRRFLVGVSGSQQAHRHRQLRCGGATVIARAIGPFVVSTSQHDIAHLRWRAFAVGAYRLWCDSGFANTGVPVLTASTTAACAAEIHSRTSGSVGRNVWAFPNRPELYSGV